MIFTQQPPDHLISSPGEWLLPWLICSFQGFEPTSPDGKPVFIGIVDMDSVLWFRFTLNKFTDCVNILMFVYTKFQHVPWQWKKIWSQGKWVSLQIFIDGCYVSDTIRMLRNIIMHITSLTPAIGSSQSNCVYLSPPDCCIGPLYLVLIFDWYATSYHKLSDSKTTAIY